MWLRDILESPAHAGMDRLLLNMTLPFLREPRARGDGPLPLAL